MIIRRCAQLGISEETDLHSGMDFRLPQYRREVFHRFYEFHLKYKAHPGAVYYVMPYLSTRYQFTREQQYWFAYINGCTQNPLTTWIIFSNFPDFAKIDPHQLEMWHQTHWRSLAYDIDRRYQKGHFVEMYLDYVKNLNGMTQVQFFEEHLWDKSPDVYFWNIWKAIYSGFHMYGRLSSFSYMEYLRIMGTPVECASLFMEDLSGSKSHRNGILKVCGRDDLEWHEATNPGIITHGPEIVAFAIQSAEELLQEAQERAIGAPWAFDVNRFTLESTLCCYKSWHRENRRYPNVYSDMFHDRIKKAEKDWPAMDFSMFWAARAQYLPEALRLENCPHDPGLVPLKQNWYRTTGEVIMMDTDWSCFTNGFALSASVPSYGGLFQ